MSGPLLDTRPEKCLAQGNEPIAGLMSTPIEAELTDASNWKQNVLPQTAVPTQAVMGSWGSRP